MKKLPTLYAVYLLFGSFLSCWCLNVLGASKAQFQTTNGRQLSIPIETGWTYRAEWSADLRQWTAFGDTFLPSTDVIPIVPENKHGFIRLEGAFPIADRELVVAVVGDSTIGDLSVFSAHYHGWGQVLGRFFKPSVRVANVAEGAVSSKGYLERNQISTIRRLKPDLVVAQFGHNDQNQHIPLADYEANLTEIVALIREAGSIPILCTPVSRRRYDEDGNLIRDLERHRQSMLSVAQQTQTSLVDLNRRSVDLYRRLGPSQSFPLTVCGDACNDQTHFSRVGAYAMASLALIDFPAILRAHAVPLSSLIGEIEDGFKHDRSARGLGTPFAEITRGLADNEFWNWIYPEGLPAYQPIQ
jgi:lysophospholipase L1-like esterase